MENKDENPHGLPTPFYGISNGNTGNGLTICDKVEQLLEGISRDAIQQPDNLLTKRVDTTEDPYNESMYGARKTDAEISETVRQFLAKDSKITAPHPADHPMPSVNDFYATDASNRNNQNGNTSVFKQQDSFKGTIPNVNSMEAKQIPLDGFATADPDFNSLEKSSNGTHRLEDYEKKKELEQEMANAHNKIANTVHPIADNTNFLPKDIAKEALRNMENAAYDFTGTTSTVSNVVPMSSKAETKDAMQQTDVVTKYHRGRRFSEPAAFDLSRSDITELLRKSLMLPAQTLIGNAVQKEAHQATENNDIEMMDTSVLNGNEVEKKQAGGEQDHQQNDNMNESGEANESMEAYSPTISERDIIDENAPPPKKAKLDPLEIHTESMGADDYEEVEDYSSSSSRSRSRSPSPQRQGFVFKLGTNQPNAVKETRNSPCSPEPTGNYQKMLVNVAAHKKKELILQAEQLKRRKIIERALGTTKASARNELLQMKLQKVMPHRKEVRDSPISPDANLNHTATPVYYRVNRDYSTIPRPQNQRENDMTKMVQDKILGEEAIRANSGEQGPSEPVKHTVPQKKTSALNQALSELLSRPVTKVVLEKHHFLPEFRPTHEYIPQIVDSAPFETHEEQMKLLYKISSNSSWIPPNRDAPLPHDRGIDYWNWTAGQFISWIASFCHNKYVLSNLLLANLNGKIIFTHEPDYSFLRNFGLNVEVSNVICHNFRIIKDKCRTYGNLGTLRLPQGFF